MAHHERGEAHDTEAGPGALGTPPELPVEGAEPEPGFNFWLLGLLVVVVALVSIQNLWLRRRAQRENAERRDSPGS